MSLNSPAEEKLDKNIMFALTYISTKAGGINLDEDALVWQKLQEEVSKVRLQPQ